MQKYERIEQIRDLENKNMISVLRYIASKKGYLSEGNIQYKNLFKNVLKPKFKEVAFKNDENPKGISRKQYKSLIKYRRGRFPVNICLYLQALYEIMLSFNQEAEITPKINDISYTEFILNYLREQIVYIVISSNLNERGYNNNIDDLQQNTFSEIYDKIITLDNASGENSPKIYNNIW